MTMFRRSIQWGCQKEDFDADLHLAVKEIRRQDERNRILEDSERERRSRSRITLPRVSMRVVET